MGEIIVGMLLKSANCVCMTNLGAPVLANSTEVNASEGCHLSTHCHFCLATRVFEYAAIVFPRFCSFCDIHNYGLVHCPKKVHGHFLLPIIRLPFETYLIQS